MMQDRGQTQVGRLVSAKPLVVVAGDGHTPSLKSPSAVAEHPIMVPFTIEVPQATLDDLHARLTRTRWPPSTADDWASGVSAAFLRELVEYWHSGFDWRVQERALNRLPQFRAEVD